MSSKENFGIDVKVFKREPLKIIFIEMYKLTF